MIKKKLAILCTSSYSLVNFRFELIKELKKNFEIDTFSEDNNYFVKSKLNKFSIKNYNYKKRLTKIKILDEFFSILNLRDLFKSKKKKYDLILIYTLKSIIFSFFIKSQNTKFIFLIRQIVLYSLF